MSETKMYFLYASKAMEFKTDIGAVTACSNKDTSVITIRLSNKLSNGMVFFTYVVQKLQCFVEALKPYIYHSPVIIPKISFKNVRNFLQWKTTPQKHQ